ncbi:TIM barrel protein [Vallitalea pronyensis]|uniref:TIM barrel protein n=1 Tax=Vallitalea pronyensis TaxID=1348613 RepID=A0A8J8SF99_9FIRM|nr:TIM barrel protein [Vallitalea pronyensis]QUI21162.1 TIM barrel protein [Vallitalea pronyensis]
MNWKIAGAPGAWGVEDAHHPHNPPYEKVLDDAALAGYKGIELGPYGYLPQEINALQEALEKRKLTIVAGTLYDDLVSEINVEKVMEKNRITCKLLSQLPKAEQVAGQRYKTPYLVVIDAVNKRRDTVAGHPEEAERLNDVHWNQLVEHIKGISVVAKEYGVRVVIHPHAGGYIEFADEIDRMMKDISADEAGLCLDTGHLYYSNMQPDAWLKKYAHRLDYVHFKDINQEVYTQVLKSHTGFFKGCEQGVMCPIGSGIVDYEKVREALIAIEYRGWITIEQERDPLLADGSLEDAKKSIAYLNARGYGL